MISRWSVQLCGSEEALNFWLSKLKRPFDPYVEMIEDERGDFVVLRSRSFAILDTINDVNEDAKSIFATIHVVDHSSLVANPIELGPIVEFSNAQLPSRTHVLNLTPIVVHVRVGTPEISSHDEFGRPVAVTHHDGSAAQPASVQRWIEAAFIDDRIRAAISHLHGEPGWIEYYKVYEVLKTVRTPNVSDEDKDRLRRTANIHRHHKTTSAPLNPMTLREASEFIHVWLNEATGSVLTG